MKGLNIRLHCLGIGSASQDRFLALLARQTGGASRFVTPHERVDVAAVDFFAGIGRAVATGLQCRAEALPNARIQPAPPSAVFSGVPVILYGACHGPGSGLLRFTWETDGATRTCDLPVRIENDPLGETLKLLQGARLITDAEAVEPEPDLRTGIRRRREQRHSRLLEELSREYGLASCAMALVAVIERPSDKPGELPTTKIVPVGMPEDVRFDAYFGHVAACMEPCHAALAMLSDEVLCAQQRVRPLWSSAARPKGFRHAVQDRAPEYAQQTPDVPADPIMDLAGCLEPDGGMPGPDLDARVAYSLAALLVFRADDHSDTSGPFRRHVSRLLQFLNGVDRAALPRKHADVLDAVLAKQQGRIPKRVWLGLAKKLVTEKRKVSAKEIWRQLQEFARTK